jgi:uncharacterized protein YggE
MKPNPIQTILLLALLAVLAFPALKPEPPAVHAADAPAAEAPAALQQEGACDSSRSVSASGTAVLYVAPDRALIKLGVQTNATTPDGARDANEREIQAVMRAIKALGIDAKDIATDNYLVYPIYQDYAELVIKGYRVDNTVSITLHDVTLADDVLVTALQSGANEVQDITFYTSELRKYRDQARDLAVRAAGEKAAALAQSAGAQTGCVLSISENSWSSYFGSWRGGREAALFVQNVMQTMPAEGGPQLEDTLLSLGQIAIQAQVNASYALQ